MTDKAAAKDPSDSASRSRAATASLELGGALRDRDPKRALAVYDKGIARLAESGNRLAARRDRAGLLAESSYPLRRLHRPLEAKARISAAVALLKDTQDYPAQQIQLGGHVYRVVCALADPEAEAGNPRVALGMYRQLLDRVMATRPDPLGDLRDTPKLSKIYGVLAVLFRRTGDSASADEMDARRGALWRQWQQKLPQNPFVLRQLQTIGIGAAVACRPPGRPGELPPGASQR